MITSSQILFKSFRILKLKDFKDLTTPCQYSKCLRKGGKTTWYSFILNVFGSICFLDIMFLCSKRKWELFLKRNAHYLRWMWRPWTCTSITYLQTRNSWRERLWIDAIPIAFISTLGSVALDAFASTCWCFSCYQCV